MSVINFLLFTLLSIHANAYNFNRTAFSSDEFDGAVCEKQVSAFFISENTQLIATPYLTYQEITEEQCLKTCSENRDAKGRFVFCSSFNFEHSTLTCTIFRTKSFPTAEEEIQPAPGLKYYEKFCVDVEAPVECSNTKFHRSDQSVIIGYARNVSITTNLEECATQCLREKFRCRSAMYFYEEGECITNTESAETKPESYAREENDKVVYFENGCSAALEKQKQLEKYDDYVSEDGGEFIDGEQFSEPMSTTLSSSLSQEKLPQNRMNSISDQDSQVNGKSEIPKLTSLHASTSPKTVEEMEESEGFRQDEHTVQEKLETTAKSSIGKPDSLETKADKTIDDYKRMRGLKRTYIGMKQIKHKAKSEPETTKDEKSLEHEKSAKSALHETGENHSNKDTEKATDETIDRTGDGKHIPKDLEKETKSDEVIEKPQGVKIKAKKAKRPENRKIEDNQGKVTDEQLEPNEGIEDLRDIEYLNRGTTGKKETTINLKQRGKEVETGIFQTSTVQNEGPKTDGFYKGVIPKAETTNFDGSEGLEEETSTFSIPKTWNEQINVDGTYKEMSEGTVAESVRISGPVTHTKGTMDEMHFTQRIQDENTMETGESDIEDRIVSAAITQVSTSPSEETTEFTVDSEEIQTMVESAKASGVIQKHQKPIKHQYFTSEEDNNYFSEWTAWTPCRALGERRIRRRKCFDLRKCIGALMEVEICNSDHLNSQSTPGTPFVPIEDQLPSAEFHQSDVINVTGANIVPSILTTYGNVPTFEATPSTPSIDDSIDDEHIWSPWSSECQTFASGQPCKEHEMIGFQSRECMSKDMSLCTGPFFRYCTIPC